MRHKKAAVALIVMCLLPGAAWARPGWTKAKPHFETRFGRVFAVAVGKAKDANPALARAAAEARAREGLLKLVEGRPDAAFVQGSVQGARVAEFYTTWLGTVYARLELETAPALPSGPP